MAKLIFLRQTDKKIEVFGCDVYFDLDGKNIGKLSRTNHEVVLAPGKHVIKMYKSYSYNIYIGFDESTIEVSENEELMVSYAASMAVNQPGNMIISSYDYQKERQRISENVSKLLHTIMRLI